MNETKISKEVVFCRTHDEFVIACVCEEDRERMILSRELPLNKWPPEMR